jgi:hypothetical protein
LLRRDCVSRSLVKARGCTSERIQIGDGTYPQHFRKTRLLVIEYTRFFYFFPRQASALDGVCCYRVAANRPDVVDSPQPIRGSTRANVAPSSVPCCARLFPPETQRADSGRGSSGGVSGRQCHVIDE